MTKILVKSAVAVIAALVVLGVASVASAASFTNVEFQNGDVTVQGTGGNAVTAKFRVVVPANEVVEKIQTDVISDSLAPVCTEVGGERGLEEGTHEVSLSVKLPPNTGTYTLAVQGSGIYGAFEAVDCTSNVVGSNSFGGALKVVAEGSGSTTSSTGEPSWFTSFKAYIEAKLAALTAPAPTTGNKAKCDAIAPHLVAPSETYSAAGVQLQSVLLLDDPNSIPALKAGSTVPMGFRGVQTNAAINAFQAKYGCI